MASTARQQGAGTRLVDVDIKAQLATTHNPFFPFSSPNVDDNPSPKSDKSSDTIRFDDSLGQDDLDSPAILHGIDFTQGRPSRKESSSHGTRWTRKSGTSLSDAKKNVRRSRRPGLQIVTDFPQPQHRAGKIVLNQVAVKQPRETRSKTRSIISQKGIKVLSSPSFGGNSAQMMSTLRDLINSNREMKANASAKFDGVQGLDHAKCESSPTRSSVVFGLRVPEFEAPLHQHSDVIQSAVTLVTPVTPEIVITPAAEETIAHLSHGASNRNEREIRSTSPTSVYSKAVSRYYTSKYTKPALPQRQDEPAAHPNHSPDARRSSSESQQEILPDSCETARPKSQGWWNLVLSPILSRAGTLKSQRTGRKDTIPPVPKVPDNFEKTLPPQTPATNISPETPRRAGLAGVRSSSWSNWTECDQDREEVDGNEASPEEPVPAIPKDYLPQRPTLATPPVTVPDFTSKGAAAEYYHACAIEQLTNVTYFECINHSCQDRRFRLLAGRDVRNKDVLPEDVEASRIEIGVSTKPYSAEPDPTAAVARSDAALVFNNESGKAMALNEKDAREQISDPASPAESAVDVAELVSPNLREAKTAAFSRARAVNSPKLSPAPVPVHDKPKAKQLSIEPKSSILSHQAMVESPGPISPEATRAVAPAGAVPMADLQKQPPTSIAPPSEPISQSNFAVLPFSQPQPLAVYYQYGPGGPHPVMGPPPTHHPEYQFSSYNAVRSGYPEARQESQSNFGVALDHHEDKPSQPEEQESKLSKEKADIKDGKKSSRHGGILCCFDRSKSKDGSKESKDKRLKVTIVAIFLLVIVILCILFALLFTRGNGSANPIASQWLNLSGYPPIPTGISTIAQPNLAASQNQCVSPTTLWSCALPKEDQAGVAPNDPDQPNFRFQIRFHNGTVPANLTIPLGKQSIPSSNSNDDSDLFVPNPAPPGLPDQKFLGNTTDNNTVPFEGEATPFFITFMNTDSGSSSAGNQTRRLLVRQSGDDGALNSIPPPDIGSDGSAAAASLLPTDPFPISQPIKLYNRGLADEHFGFYMYYDKSIFLSGQIIQNDTAINNTQSSPNADQNGGSTKQAATIRCTWSQTRFVVKMYTNPAFNAHLLPRSTASNSSASTAQKDNLTQSATDFNRPGSFPYPTTILLDRHGGDVNKKLLYCYGMDNENIVSDEKVLLGEFRAFGGTLVNPAPALLSTGNSTFNSDSGGIDGGSGGCGCTWQNWT